MNKSLLIALGVFLAVVVAGMFLLKKPKVEAPSQGMPVPGATNVEEKVVNEDEQKEAEAVVREVTVSGNEYSFNPSSLTFKKGEPIRLTFTNVGTTPHDLIIDELGVRTKTISRGKSDTVEFTVEKEGTFTFYCNIANHQSLGMEGEVKVE